MAGLDERLEAALGVPVLDGVVCAVKLLEAVPGYGWRTSKRGAYGTPRPREVAGPPPVFARPYAGD